LAEVEASLSHDGASATASILLVDADPRQRDALVVEGSHRGMSVAEADDITAARAAVLVCPPNLILLEVGLPGAYEFLDWLTREYPQIGIAVLSSQGGIESRLEVAKRGGRLYLEKPLAASTVLDEIQERLGVAGEHRPYRVLVLGQAAPAPGFEITSVNDLGGLWTSLQAGSPDLLLLDLEQHSSRALELCKVLRGDPRRGHLPILALAAQCDAALYRQALEAGADDVSFGR
jgi:DNA-binding response OmpR family regulator